MQKHLFVCGCARSGTSALVQLLNQDPAIFVGMERYISLLLRTGRLTPDLFTPERFFDIREGDTHYTSFDTFSVYKNAEKRFAEAKFIGDKIPRIYDYYRPIASAFPNAKFIYIVRNIFDVAASFKQRATNTEDVHWGRKRDANSAISEWNRSLRATIDFFGTGKVHIVNFEELFVQGLGIDRLAKFLGMEMPKQSAWLAQNVARAAAPSAAKKSDVLTPIEKSEILRSADIDAYRQIVRTSGPAAANPMQKPQAAARPVPKPPAPFRKYEAEDRDIVDYDYTPLEGCSFAVRGPIDRGTNSRNIICLGSAATFGRYVEKPYPSLIRQKLHANVTNLGFGGARFETYLKEPAALSLCKESDLVVLELMSARSYRSDVFEPRGHLGGLGALGQRYADMISETNPKSPLLQDRLFVDRAYEWASKNLDWEELLKVREQILESYRSDAVRLIQEIGRPVVLLWLSQRSMDATPKPGSAESLSCGFPHFVDRKTVEALRTHAVGFVEIVSKHGIPSKLVRRTDATETETPPATPTPAFNNYYPSPEMHQDTAQKLAAAIAKFWGEPEQSAPAVVQEPARNIPNLSWSRLRRAIGRYRPFR